jgi:uncharacterized membrane protein (DUF373 family)
MKKPASKTIIPIIGITLILIAVLSRRMFIRGYSADSTLSFLAGFAVILLCYLLLRVFLNNKK